MAFGIWILWYLLAFMKLQLPTYHGPQEVGEGLVVGHHVLHAGVEAGPLPGLPPWSQHARCLQEPLYLSLTSLTLHLDSFWLPGPAPLCWHQEAASVSTPRPGQGATHWD